MSYHILTPDPYEGNARRHTAVGPPPTGHEQRGISGGVIATGYLCGFASLFIFPPALALAGIVIGIVCLVRERLGHGIALLIVSTMCGWLGMWFGAINGVRLVNNWLTTQTQMTAITRKDSTPAQKEQQKITYEAYTADDFYSMAKFGCRWNGHRYVPLPPALDPSVPYPALRRTLDMTSLPEGLPVTVTGSTGTFLFGTFVRTAAIELPNDLVSALSSLNTSGHWMIAVHGSNYGSSVGCAVEEGDATFYDRALSNSITVVVSGRYYKSGHGVLYPCHVEELLDYSGDDISR